MRTRFEPHRRRKGMTRGALCALLPLMVAACATPGGEPTDPRFDPAVDAGRRIVIRACAGCHSTSTDAPSVYRAAPPFWSLGLEYTPGSLQRVAADADGHRFAMPSIVLTSREAAEVVAYMRAVAAADPATRRRLGAPPCIVTAGC